MDCYNSSDPAAVNATIVYDYNDHQGDLWSRNIEDVQDQPLLHCSSTSLPLETQCTVCLNQVVYAVCHKLKDGVVLTMEALERHIKISKSDCPKLLSDAPPQWPLVLLVSLLVLVLLIFALCFYFYQRQKRQRTRTPQKAGSRSLTDVQQEAPLTATS